MKTENLEPNAVFQLDDFSSIKLLSGYNESICEAYVNALVAAYKRGYHFNPILISKNYYLINGSHKMEAARRLNISLSVLQYDITDKKSINKLILSEKSSIMVGDIVKVKNTLNVPLMDVIQVFRMNEDDVVKCVHITGNNFNESVFSGGNLEVIKPIFQNRG